MLSSIGSRLPLAGGEGSRIVNLFSQLQGVRGNPIEWISTRTQRWIRIPAGPISRAFAPLPLSLQRRSEGKRSPLRFSLEEEYFQLMSLSNFGKEITS